MSAHHRSGVGAVVSGDIAVPEHAREVRFYARVLGTGPRPLWREDLMNNLGQPIIGLGERVPEYDQLPLQWMPHIQVADVAASVERGLELGGSELLHGKDEHGNSQWAVLLDPIGAAFGLIPIVPAEDAPTTGDAAHPVGRIAGIELTVPNPATSCDYYRTVVDCTSRKLGGNGRELLGAGGERIARIHQADGQDPNLPSTWMLLLPVGDLAESLRLVEQEGGAVLRTTDEGGRCTHAVVRDPVGAHFALVQQ